LLKDRLTISGDPNAEFLPILLTTATNIGSLLCDGIRDAILVQGEEVQGQDRKIDFTTGLRSSV
jgi:(E)-4-hydroxy-3-methylbut-2-enyl-diphosphate synthase